MKDNKDSEKTAKILLTFLEKTREGRYAKIEESSLAYVRIKEQRQAPQYAFFYSYR